MSLPRPGWAEMHAEQDWWSDLVAFAEGLEERLDESGTAQVRPTRNGGQRRVPSIPLWNGKPSAGLEPDASRDGERRRRFAPAGPEAQRRTRTGDPFLTMEVLYQLS
jgi:hypothetical protein